MLIYPQLLIREQNWRRKECVCFVGAFFSENHLSNRLVPELFRISRPIIKQHQIFWNAQDRSRSMKTDVLVEVELFEPG
ncbi:hypothetical protein AVEN_73942-1 [Araneus ventricosus]|uniref:Uncharacterized protein n=1 Tax=Araneus ventricosus TaxID=182803 RepID=A0A4Y2JS90_ARAVE|nr:hypothetical protein AVEN_73942-1 [Araneus ventricosus]